MHFSVVSSFDDVSPACWTKLAESCPDSTIFQSYEWLSACEKCLPQVAGSVQIVVAREGDQLLAAAPLFRAGQARGCVWKFIGDDYSDYQVFPVSDGSPATMVSLIDHLISLMEPADTLQLNDVPQFSLLADSLSGNRSIGAFTIKMSGVTECPAIEIANNPVGVARVKRKSSVRRSLASLSRRGSVRVTHSTDTAAISAELPAFFEQHVRRWRDSPFPSLFLQEHNRDFYRNITSCLGKRGAVLLTEVQVNDVAVAYHYGLISGTKLLWYKPTFDVDYAQHSPGDTLVTSIIEEATHSGRDLLDFTRGAESFKYRFASMVGFNYRFEVRRPSYHVAARLGRAIRSIKGKFSTSARDAIDLGGAPIRARSSSVLLLDYDERRHAVFGAALRSFGASVEVVPRDFGSSENAQEEELFKRKTSGMEDPEGRIDQLDRAHKYGLIVAFDALTAESVVRRRLSLEPHSGNSLLPDAIALDTLRKRLEGLNSEDGVNAFGFERRSTISAHLLCLYAHGRLAFRAFIPREETSGTDLEAQRRVASICHDICLSVGWHGIAAFSLAKEGENGFRIISVDPTASCEMPDSVARELALALWCLTQGVHLRAV